MFCAAESWRSFDHVFPPSSENTTRTGSPKNVNALPRNWVQLTYTRPKNGELGFRSTHTSSLSLNRKPCPFAAITGSGQLTPLLSEAQLPAISKFAGVIT